MEVEDFLQIVGEVQVFKQPGAARLPIRGIQAGGPGWQGCLVSRPQGRRQVRLDCPELHRALAPEEVSAHVLRRPRALSFLQLPAAGS